MPSWIKLVATDLADYLVGEQLDALRTEALAPGQRDPFTKVSADVIAKVRSYIASNPDNVVDSDPLTIPPELKIDVCYLIIAPMLGRLGQSLTKDQSQAIELAQTTLVALREKKLLVTRPDNAVAPAVQAPGGITVISSTRRESTRETLRGL